MVKKGPTKKKIAANAEKKKRKHHAELKAKKQRQHGRLQAQKRANHKKVKGKKATKHKSHPPPPPPQSRPRPATMEDKFRTFVQNFFILLVLIVIIVLAGATILFSSIINASNKTGFIDLPSTYFEDISVPIVEEESEEKPIASNVLFTMFYNVLITNKKINTTLCKFLSSYVNYDITFVCAGILVFAIWTVMSGINTMLLFFFFFKNLAAFITSMFGMPFVQTAFAVNTIASTVMFCVVFLILGIVGGMFLAPPFIMAGTFIYPFALLTSLRQTRDNVQTNYNETQQTINKWGFSDYLSYLLKEKRKRITIIFLIACILEANTAFEQDGPLVAWIIFVASTIIMCFTNGLIFDQTIKEEAIPFERIYSDLISPKEEKEK